MPARGWGGGSTGGPARPRIGQRRCRARGGTTRRVVAAAGGGGGVGRKWHDTAEPAPGVDARGNERRRWHPTVMAQGRTRRRLHAVASRGGGGGARVAKAALARAKREVWSTRTLWGAARRE
jgi:hypothetical protein